jgi:parvulin-like peptidyl-prolyl isomerase
MPEARQALDAEDESERTEVSTSPSAPPGGYDASTSPSPAPAPEAGGNLANEVEDLALSLQGNLRVAQSLELDPTGTAEALASAAMSAARGNLEDSRRTLLSALETLEPALAHRFDEAIANLEEREGRLREDGVAADVARDLSRARTAFREGAKFEAVSALKVADEELNELERDWKHLKETLLRIDAFRDVGRRLSLDLSTIDARLMRVRGSLADETLNAEDLREAGSQAAATLILVHEQVRQHLLDRALAATEALDRYGFPPGGRARAERRVGSLQRHARAGRFKEASEELFQLRREYPGLLSPPAPAPIPEPPGNGPPVAEEPHPQGPPGTAASSAPSTLPSGAPTEEVSAREILADARELAGHLKARQNEGADVREAASLLMAATRQLQAHQTVEARETLRRLRRSLGEPEGPEGG